jgi:dienelactone hydrolase
VRTSTALRVALAAAALVAGRATASAEGDDLGVLLAAAVDQPTPQARYAAAVKLAERNDVTVAQWLDAMRKFRATGPVVAGTRTEKATLQVGDAKEEAQIAVYVPKAVAARGASTGAPAPLLLAFHGSGGEGHDSDDLWTETAEALGMIVVAPTDKTADLGYRYTEPERQRAMAALRWARRRFDVDENRVFVTGVSRGGHLSWDLALRHPDQFAALAPMIGGPRLLIAEGQNNLRYVENAARLPIRDLQGSKDDARLVENLRNAFKKLASCGAKDAQLVEFADMGHDFDPKAVDWTKFFGGAARESPPLRVVRCCSRLDEARAAWIEATGFWPTVKEQFRPEIEASKLKNMSEDDKRAWGEDEAEKRTARIEAKFDGPGKFTVKTSLVQRFRILLAEDMFDPAKPVEITTNDKTARHDAQAGKLVLLREFVERFDRTFLPVAEVAGP